MHRLARSLLLPLGLSAVAAAGRASAQTAPSGRAAEQAPEVVGDAATGEARAAQARFETERLRWLPVDLDWGSGPCDENLGRMCLRDDAGGDWYPVPEDERIGAARAELLAALAAAAERAPSDPWILGQRVFYLGEAGRWDDARALAAACGGGGAEDEWCRALEGLALHALGRYEESERAFRAALAADPERAAAWLDPAWLLDATGRRWWSDLDDDGRERLAERVWALGDPLLLVPGNDLLTEHWARLTVARIRADARNPYGMRWGSDLEQLLVRYGWEIGWERAPRSYGVQGPISAVGHHDPESRPLFPPGDALVDPVAAPEAAWTPDERSARSAYAPGYAPVLLPGAGRIAVFPRGDRMVVVGDFALPDDTTEHARHDHPARDSVPPRWRGLPDEAGLFLIPADDPTAAPVATRVVGRAAGRLALEAPAGRWIASLEVLSPALRRAGRTRVGIDRPALPPDLLTLSDLLLTDGALPADATLEDAAARALGRSWVRAGERIGIAWELFGLGYREEALAYRLTVGNEEEGLLRRALRGLRLVGPRSDQRLEWDEAAPDRSGPALRSVALELPPLPPGRYRIRLEVVTSGRPPLVREVVVELRP